MGLFIHRDLTYKEDDVNNGIEQLKATNAGHLVTVYLYKNVKNLN